MTRKFGVQSTGLIAPIIREGDNLCKIVVDTVLDSGLKIEDDDIIGITESVVARAEGNYVTVDEVAEDIRKKIGNHNYITVISPIFSRNRFAMILKAIARAAQSGVHLRLDYVDEVGNVYRCHPFTGINYDEYYKSIIEGEGKYAYIKLPNESINYDFDSAIDCRLHPVGEKLGKFTLADFCNDKCEYGLLGSNKASEEKLKLFPSKKYSQRLINDIQQEIELNTGKVVEVMIYGDGCFKDPVGGIWEFADPVTSPTYTRGLEGTPNELKLKNIADEKYVNLNGKELEEAVKEDIKNKDNNLKGNMVSQGTTPRRYVDLLASLMDLTSGSGDKGTPIVYVKRYFENYGTEK